MTSLTQKIQEAERVEKSLIEEIKKLTPRQQKQVQAWVNNFLGTKYEQAMADKMPAMLSSDDD